jgi:hypothetical protein
MPNKSLRTVESVMANLADREAVTFDVDPRVRWALLDKHAVDSLSDWIGCQATGRAQHLTARFSGPNRMLIVQAELRGNVAALCMVRTRTVGDSMITGSIRRAS